MSDEERRLRSLESGRAWRERNRDKSRAASRKYYHAHKAQSAARHAVYRVVKKAEIHRMIRKRRLLVTYGITTEQYDAMLVAQGGVCGICGADAPGGWGKYFSVDHHHETGVVRGLLCWTCNVGLGSFKDSPGILEKAAAYLAASEALREVA